MPQRCPKSPRQRAAERAEWQHHAPRPSESSWGKHNASPPISRPRGVAEPRTARPAQGARPCTVATVLVPTVCLAASQATCRRGCGRCRVRPHSGHGPRAQPAVDPAWPTAEPPLGSLRLETERLRTRTPPAPRPHTPARPAGEDALGPSTHAPSHQGQRVAPTLLGQRTPTRPMARAMTFQNPRGCQKTRRALQDPLLCKNTARRDGRALRSPCQLREGGSSPAGPGVSTSPSRQKGRRGRGAQTVSTSPAPRPTWGELSLKPRCHCPEPAGPPRCEPRQCPVCLPHSRAAHAPA